MADKTAAALSAVTDEPAAAEQGLVLDLDALDAGDIEDIEEHCGRPVLGLINNAIRQAAKDPAVNMTDFLPAKVLTGLLGVAKRRQDPSFTPDKWRTVKLSEIAGGPRPPSPPAPSTNGTSGKRGRSTSTSGSG